MCGVVVRDDQGMVIGAAAKRVFGSFSPHVGKCIVVREGAWFTQLLGASSWSMETDAINVVCMINNPNAHSLEANIVEDICNSLNRANSGHVCYAQVLGLFCKKRFVEFAINPEPLF
ncbi:hypothetical protein TIFTF001_031053 [Ficus carica]|uniref:RNase H type-1 domain-containing protein n=1 Tax=Ficus carica TaxID=3494 RepID=A0AA88DUC1_FICCA|nr:hypothetical protein TIFTF001_031053 [Ficus carica]